MATRTARRRRGARAARGILGQVKKWIPLASFESTFLGNAIDNINAQPDLMMKAKTLVNAHTGKVLGLNLFNDAPKFGVKVGFSNIGNPLVIAGATMLVAGVIGKRLGLPYVGQLKSLGTKIAVPAAIGSIFEGDVGVGQITNTPTITQTSSGSQI
jgi:hypothetical protein